MPTTVLYSTTTSCYLQEAPNFLRGYHKCSPEESLQLGALLFLAKYGKEKQPFEQIE